MSANLTLRTLRNFSTKQKYLFLFGAPGVGKGTYAQLLAKDLGIYTKCYLK
jgi:Holliday junction resolvasome RuvABC ATP-dependent DNA helicase subunit